MAEKNEDKDFLEYVVKAIVDYPDDVNVDREVDEMGVLMTLDVHADDMGKVIGRSGNTAKALRTLLRVVGMKNQARVNLKIREPEEREGGPALDSDNDEEPVKESDDSNGASTSVDDAMEELKS
ncbi:MAG: KH domain-containing protein [Candidatus Paceibacterota bacterium]